MKNRKLNKIYKPFQRKWWDGISRSVFSLLAKKEYAHDFDSLKEIINSAGSKSRVIEIVGKTNVTEELFIPENIRFKFLANSGLIVDTHFRVTCLNKSFQGYIK